MARWGALHSGTPPIRDDGKPHDCDCCGLPTLIDKRVLTIGQPEAARLRILCPGCNGHRRNWYETWAVDHASDAWLAIRQQW